MKYAGTDMLQLPVNPEANNQAGAMLPEQRQDLRRGGPPKHQLVISSAPSKFNSNAFTQSLSSHHNTQLASIHNRHTLLGLIEGQELGVPSIPLSCPGMPLLGSCSSFWLVSCLSKFASSRFQGYDNDSAIINLASFWPETLPEWQSTCSSSLNHPW